MITISKIYYFCLSGAYIAVIITSRNSSEHFEVNYASLKMWVPVDNLFP